MILGIVLIHGDVRKRFRKVKGFYKAYMVRE